ncbi:MAG: glutamyl-tRNA amidotransferase [Rhodospirillales bacterium RIFCSPLOWO2_01_FULL_65_14]|nr:MAG: glutamyl-tRNA amidotransferase [Rhodospirillales bacterium RIFCSPLOWO2_01_FULL_65_14]
MIRQRLNDALKAAMKAKEELSVSTLRLILAALKDRDIAARTKGKKDGIPDEEVLGLLQSMIKQRRESIAAYEKGGRQDLAQKEAGEIAIIEGFLPQQMSEAEMAKAIDSVIESVAAASLKDMGKAMAALKQQFAGQMDFAKASALVKQRLS